MTQAKAQKRSLTSGLLPFARGLVLALILLSIATLLLGIALYPSSGASTLATIVPNDRWTLETTQAALDQLGWSPLALSWFYAILGWATAVAYCAVGLIVFSRKGHSWFALYVAVTFGVLGTSAGPTSEVMSHAYPFLAAWQELTTPLSWQFLLILFYMFPDGRFVPAWTRWLIAAWVLVNILWALAPNLTDVLAPFIFALALSTMAGQIYRYYRYPDAVQRQQTKWIVFMVAGLIGIFLLMFLSFYMLDPDGPNPGRSYMIATSIQALSDFWLLLIPVAVAIAILKYRLWDIDIIIRRTLVYVPLTAILAGVLSASVKLTQTFFSSAGGEQSEAATVLTTLIVVAAFDPVKGWLQRRVDALFKDGPSPAIRWAAYGEEVHSFVGMIDTEASARRLLAESLAAFEADSGAVYLNHAGKKRLVHRHGHRTGPPIITIPIHHNTRSVGSLELGTRRSGRVYGEEDRASLENTAAAVAQAIALVSGRPRSS
jgi:hypothetical protein